MIRVNRQIKCPKSWGPGWSPSPTGSFFENYTYLWNHFVNFNQTLPKCSLGDPLPKLFFSFLLIYKTRPNDFDLQLGCCISDAFSIFLFSFPCPWFDSKISSICFYSVFIGFNNDQKNCTRFRRSNKKDIEL